MSVFSGNSQIMSDAAIATGLAFLTGELEELHPTVNMPLAQTTWARDIPFDMGGGPVELVSNFFAEFATAGTNEDGIITGETNVIPVIQATMSKDLARVFPWANNLRVTFLNAMKLIQAGKSIDSILDTGLRLNYGKTLDKSCYTGFTAFGSTGLVNSPLVTASTFPVGASTSTLWANKTPDEILKDWNAILTNVWTSVEYVDDAIPDRILMPPAAFSYLNSVRLSQYGDISLMTYLMRNNIATNRGRNLVVLPCRQCIGAGAGGLDRIVAYSMSKERLQFDLTVPLQKNTTTFSNDTMAYLTNYLSFFSELQIKYPQTVRYGDGV